MTYVLNAEVSAAWKVHVCLSTLACQQTTESVYANSASQTTCNTLKILNHKKGFFTGPLGLETTIKSILIIFLVFDFEDLIRSKRKIYSDDTSRFSSEPMLQWPMPSQCNMPERIYRQELHLPVSSGLQGRKLWENRWDQRECIF